MRDLKEKRKVLSLKIYCIYREDGCSWEGTVQEINEHLSRGKMEGECIYVSLSCPHNCGAKARRSEIKKHIEENCVLRPYSCKYCFYSATYQEVIGRHYDSVCLKYPVICPNRCNDQCMPRGEVEKHLNECPLQVISCTYRKHGCQERFVRSKLPQHLKDEVHEHLSLVTEQLEEFVTKVQLMESEVLGQRFEEEGTSKCTYRGRCTASNCDCAVFQSHEKDIWCDYCGHARGRHVQLGVCRNCCECFAFENDDDGIVNCSYCDCSIRCHELT